jgi:phosphoribosylglycinamide formyltransferase-1
MRQPIRLAVLISGSGTTLQNLIDRIAAGRLNAAIAGVISSRADAFGLERARRAAIPTRVVEHASAGASFASEVWAAVRSLSPELVCFAGWLKLLPIADDFRWKVLNIHPALLPAFGGRGMYGRKVHEAVLASGAKVSGCTVHFADDAYDTGPILVQKCVEVKSDDDPASLAARVFTVECEAYPEAIELIAAGRVKVVDGRAVISG